MSIVVEEGSATALTTQERAIWFAWKRAHDVIRARIAEDVASATGLSDPDMAVLIRLDESDGTLRQNRLVSWLGWDASRLSHQLTRMESRGLLTRRKLTNGMEIELTAEGRTAIAEARPVHTKAVRRHLLRATTTAEERAAFLATLQKLAGDESDGAAPEASPSS